MIRTFPDIRIKSEICSDILQKSILIAEIIIEYKKRKDSVVAGEPFGELIAFGEKVSSLDPDLQLRI